MGEEHGQATVIHKVYEWEHADATARNAESVINDDIGKVSWQQDTDKFYVLADTAPTWVEFTSSYGFQGDTGVQGDTGDGPGDTGIQGDTGAGDTGFQGDTGIQGDTGVTQGDTGYTVSETVTLHYDFNTTTTAPPSSGEIRFNNADPWSATTIWIHGIDRNGVSQTHIMDLFRAGNMLWLNSEVNGDLVGYYILWVSYASGYYTVTVYARNAIGSFANGEDIQCVFNSMINSYGVRRTLNVPTHVDGTWYSIPGYYGEIDSTLIMSAIVSGHSDDAVGATWAYYVIGWMRNDNDVRTWGFSTPVVITEYDSAYDVRLENVGGDAVRVQVRRSGGADYDITWSTRTQCAMWTVPF